MAYNPIRFAGSGLQFLNLPFGDTTYTKVFVGGLAWETSSETLHRHFEQYGEILEAVVITDKYTGRSKGYGFVTFRDPEAATRACVDPSPVIDGRRANCNLASLGRPQSTLPYGNMRSPVPYFGGLQAPRVPYLGNPNYQQPVSYGYQPGFSYPHGYTAYGPEYVYPQGIYSPYVGQGQMYGLPGTVNPTLLPYGQISHNAAPGGVGYRSFQNLLLPGGPHTVQYARPGLTGPNPEAIPSIQTPHFTGTFAPRGVVPAHPRELSQNNSASDQTSG